jgi:hypothetical protein
MDGDYVNEYIMKATEILFPEKQQLFEAIRTSANTVPDRVIVILWNMQLQLMRIQTLQILCSVLFLIEVSMRIFS